MKLSCEIIEDLMPLYADDVCSEQSKRAVAEHLKECETCRKLMERSYNIPELTIEPEKPAADQVVAKSFRKIRLRWWVSLLLVLLLVPVCILGWNQYQEQGIFFTNLHEIYIGNAFMRELQKGDYEGAFSYIDVEGVTEEWLEEFFDAETMANIKEDSLSVFCDAAVMLDDAGGIEEYQYIGIQKQPFNYALYYTVLIDGEAHPVTVDVTDQGVGRFRCGGSFLDDPIAHLGMWPEYLWEDYEGCYYDPETGTYIYYGGN